MISGTYWPVSTHYQQRLQAATQRCLLADLDYALHVNAKKLEARSDHADRDMQFTYIAAQRQAFLDAHLPIISLDTKKKELIGTFKNAGQAWGPQAAIVGTHERSAGPDGHGLPLPRR